MKIHLKKFYFVQVPIAINPKKKAMFNDKKAREKDLLLTIGNIHINEEHFKTDYVQYN